MIIVHPGLLDVLSPRGGPAASLTLIDHVTTPTFEFLAASLGNIYVASVYIKITKQSPDYDDLVDMLFSLRPPRCQHVILGGDFNYDRLWGGCHALFKEMGVSSVVTANRKTIPCTHYRGACLGSRANIEGSSGEFSDCHPDAPCD